MWSEANGDDMRSFCISKFNTTLLYGKDIPEYVLHISLGICKMDKSYTSFIHPSTFPTMKTDQAL